MADSDLLKQAALNIVVNAIEAMPQGGELRFESSMEGEEAEIRISDSGPGIPPDQAGEDLPALLHDQEERFRDRPGHDFPNRAVAQW